MDPFASTSAPLRPAPHTTNGHAAGRDGRSLAGLFSDLWHGASTLVHEEIALARTDMSDKLTLAARASTSIAVGAGIALAGLVVLLVAAANALAAVLPPGAASWLAPLIVGAAALIVGLITLSFARNKLSASSLEPSRSMQSLRRDGQLVKERMQ